MELSLTQFVTIDGVCQAPGAPQEDTSDGFTHGGWTAPYFDEAGGEFMNQVFARADAFLLGRRTYEIFAGYWPQHDDPADPIASNLNALPKYVGTHTLSHADWAGTEVLRGDLAQRVAELKSRPGREIQIHGSGNLAQTLLAAGLIDTLHLLTFPVLLGTGKRLFAKGSTPTAFHLTDSRTTPTGVHITTYRAAGTPEYGTVGE
ncbi:dihydrofolate reductase family protein [Nocardia amikacinitolerans]|uniref:dihydrofolate reductase family protein n=1 Tax=Nocardia amikacinitolerans TaxID=756689 RepID=UPI0020A2D4B7|nr:dihydrofolate reductase family protein [Nocardia amikacinitolerans]MCP2278590.1 Dihydrofolate reductase [Nocardia amikacinitolerans]